MVFQHSGAQVFDLGGGLHYSGSYPMVFQHSDSPHTAAARADVLHLSGHADDTIRSAPPDYSNPLDCPPNGTSR